MINRTLTRHLVISALFTGTLLAQSNGQLLSRFSFGATGGVQLTQLDSDSITHYESPRYTLGPAVEFAINDHIAVEFNPLYKRFGYSLYEALSVPIVGPLVTVVSTTSRNRTNAWEFPILGKYYFGGRDRSWRGFVGTGYAWETEWRTVDATVIVTSPIPGASMQKSKTGEVRSSNWAGIIFNGGAVFQKGRLGIAPEVRYTHWGGGGTVVRDENQCEFLVTLRF